MDFLLEGTINNDYTLNLFTSLLKSSAICRFEFASLSISAMLQARSTVAPATSETPFVLSSTAILIALMASFIFSML